VGKETEAEMTPEQVQAVFTRSDGQYLFARWGRAIVPVVFGLDDATLPVMKGAIEAVVGLAGHEIAAADPELGANLMVFFFRDWAELPDVPNLAKLIPDLVPLCARLHAAGANQYRAFRFDPAGAIKAAFVFVRMDAALDAVPADVLALSQAVQVILLWSDRAFAERSPLVDEGAGARLRPEIAALIRAGYAPLMPAVARDAAHAYRLAARL
jgi:hypothetical protein